jgi:hypothetical protein
MLSPHLPVSEACTFTLDSSDSSTATTNIVTFDLLFILFYFIGFYLFLAASSPCLVSTAYCIYVITRPFALALNF